VLSRFGIPPSLAELQPPYPNWEEWQVQIIEEAISEAWRHLRKEQRKWLSTANEEAITEKLEIILARMRQDGHTVEGYNDNYFAMPHREPSVPNHDGTKIRKSPDLVFRRTTESKIIDATHGIGRYANDGIERFCNGDYASSMQFAAMVAYVRTPPRPHLTASACLKNEFQRVRRNGVSQHQSLKVLSGPEACAKTKLSPPVQITDHARSKLTTTKHSTPIQLRHIWLNL
jgi:hypothetical protein